MRQPATFQHALANLVCAHGRSRAFLAPRAERCADRTAQFRRSGDLPFAIAFRDDPALGDVPGAVPLPDTGSRKRNGYRISRGGACSGAGHDYPPRYAAVVTLDWGSRAGERR